VTEAIPALTSAKDSAQAGAELGHKIRRGFRGAAPDAIIVFASAQHEYGKLLSVLAECAGTDMIVGSSSAGEFTHRARGEGHVSALALRSQTMDFAIGVGSSLKEDPQKTASTVVSTFRGLAGRVRPYRAALVMSDALAGHADAVVEALTVATGGNYKFFGGGAGDDGRFNETHVFARTQALSDAVVALEILSDQPIGVGVSHGWVPASAGMRVTEVDGLRLVSLNGVPAVEAFAAHARETEQKFDAADPLPFFLHNIIGIETAGSYRLRVPLGVADDGSVLCAARIPLNSVVHIMKTTTGSAVVAAEQATRAALQALGGRRPGGALVFDCVATRLRMGRAFDEELKACASLLQPAGFIGCNTYGQIARAEGQFGGFHNCTAVVCVLPQ
jgi:hypothetical protein